MSFKHLLLSLVILIGIGGPSYGQTITDGNSKAERKYHNKENSKFVSQAKAIQEQIKSIRDNKNLSDAEKKTKIKPLFDEMKRLRELNVANRQWEDGDKAMAKKPEAKASSMSDKKKIKKLQKEINRIKKDGSLTEAEKRAKLDPIHKEMMAIKTGKKVEKDIVTAPRARVLKTDTADKKAERNARDKWKADRAAERKADMERELNSRKAKREKAREKREKNIEEWKAKARKEKRNMESKKSPMATSTETKAPATKKTTAKKKTAKAVKGSSKKMTQPTTANAMNHDPLDVKNDPVNTKTVKKRADQSRMLKRLSAMSDRLTSLKDGGLINPTHFQKKMAHIRKLRERFLKP